jgi:hypothetical protein
MYRNMMLRFIGVAVSLIILISVIALPVEAADKGWFIRTVDAMGDTGTWTTLEVDPRGVVHISYGSGEFGEQPRYAYLRNGYWKKLKVPGCSGAAGISMDVDEYGLAHFACHKFTPLTNDDGGASFIYDLIYSNSGGEYETAYHYQDSAVNLGILFGTAIDINTFGLPDIKHGYSRVGFSYLDGADIPQPIEQGLFDTYKDATGIWIHSYIGDGEMYWDQHYDALNGNHIVGFQISSKAGQGDVMYTCPEGCETVQKGYDAALDLDYKGHPHLSFGKDGALWYAFKPNDKGWVFEIVDPIVGNGRYTDIAVDAKGFPHISYYDEDRGDLKYATRDEKGWQISVVDSVGNVGKWSSIDVDALGRPHISYYNALRGDLKYAFRP